MRRLWFGLAAVVFLAACKSGTPAHEDAGGKPLSFPLGKTATLIRVAGDPVCNFERINETWSVAVKQPAIVARTASVVFSGWALDADQKSLASAVDLSIDGRPFDADYGVERNDVASYLKAVGARDSGFRLLLPAGSLATGHHTVSIRVVSKDGKSYREGVPIAFNIQ